MATAVEVTCQCGSAFATTVERIAEGRGRYCGRPCMYRFRVRPTGLTYQKHRENPTSFKRGHVPWSAGMKGLRLSLATEFKPGQRPSPETEFQPGARPWNAGTVGVMPTGGDHHAFKGDDVGYGALHLWVLYHRGAPGRCEHCGVPERTCDGKRRIEWANRSRQYQRDLDDWIALCSSCHHEYDKNDLGAIARKWGK
jgi:hypothetical protein